MVVTPKPRLGKSVIRGFILHAAQFFARERKQNLRYLFCFPLAYSYFATSREVRLHPPYNKVVINAGEARTNNRNSVA